MNTDDLLRKVATSLEQVADRVGHESQPKAASDSCCRVEAKLDEILALLRNNRPQKDWYSVIEVAERTKTEGVQKYERWSIRQACNLGLVPGAQQADNRQWRIPYASLMKILNEGLPKIQPSG